MKHLSAIIVFIVVGCVPYHQQVYNQQVRTLSEIAASSKRGETIANKVLYQNQLDFENHNIDCGGEITLQHILAKDDQMGTFDIIITDNTLLIPVEGYSEVITYSNYSLVWDGKLKINDLNKASVDLIFVQSVPEKIPISSRTQESRMSISRPDRTIYRQARHPTLKYVSFDLTKLRDAYSNSVTLNLLGLDFEMEYTYP